MQLSIEKLERILEKVKKEKDRLTNHSLSSTIEIKVKKSTDTHGGDDSIQVWLLSNYSECVGTVVFED